MYPTEELRFLQSREVIAGIEKVFMANQELNEDQVSESVAMFPEIGEEIAEICARIVSIEAFGEGDSVGQNEIRDRRTVHFLEDLGINTFWDRFEYHLGLHGSLFESSVFDQEYYDQEFQEEDQEARDEFIENKIDQLVERFRDWGEKNGYQVAQYSTSDGAYYSEQGVIVGRVFPEWVRDGCTDFERIKAISNRKFKDGLLRVALFHEDTYSLED